MDRKQFDVFVKTKVKLTLVNGNSAIGKVSGQQDDLGFWFAQEGIKQPFFVFFTGVIRMEQVFY